MISMQPNQPRMRLFVVSGFTIRVMLSDDLSLPTHTVMDRSPLDTPHFVPWGGEPDEALKDIVTIQLCVFKDCLADRRRMDWEEYLSQHCLWEKDDRDVSRLVYVYEMSSDIWRSTLEYFFGACMDPSQCVSMDHVVQITSDMPLDELETFWYGENSSSKRRDRYDSWESSRTNSKDVVSYASSSECSDSFVLGENNHNNNNQNGINVYHHGNDDHAKMMMMMKEETNGKRNLLSYDAYYDLLMDNLHEQQQTHLLPLPAMTTVPFGHSDQTSSDRCANSKIDDKDETDERQKEEETTDDDITRKTKKVKKEKREKTFVSFLEEQETKRIMRKQLRQQTNAQRDERQAAAAATSSSPPSSDVNAPAKKQRQQVAPLADVAPNGPRRRNKKKKMKGASRRVHREISSALPSHMKMNDSDLVVARGLFKRGIDCAQNVLDLFKHYLRPTGSDNTFSTFVSWNCNCHCDAYVTTMDGCSSENDGCDCCGEERRIELSNCGDIERTTRTIYEEIVTCLVKENKYFQPVQPIECCRIDYYGGSGETPIRSSEEPLICHGSQSVSVITLSLLSPRNYVIESQSDGSRHSFHVRNGDIIIHDGLFFKHFGFGFEQNKERIHSHSSPRLSLTFMPILNHNCSRRLNPHAMAFDPFFH